MIKVHGPLLGLLLTSFACGDPPEALAPDSEDELTTIGDRPFTNSLAIPVCFTNAESVYDGASTLIPMLGTVSSHVNVPANAQAGYVLASFSITHGRVGDLVVDLIHGSQVWHLANREGGAARVLSRTIELSPAPSGELGGDWELRIMDRAPFNAGSLVSFRLDLHHLRHTLEPQLTRIRDAVTAGYADTRIRFTGWSNTCANRSDQIRVTVYESDRGGGNTGNTDVHVPIHETIDWTPNWIHEFGHALGLPHEHWNPLGPCSAEYKRADYDWNGPYDPHSIMNYCGYGNSLTALDELALAKKYGFPGTYFRSPSGYTIRILLDGTVCHVLNPLQMQAFGGDRMVLDSTYENSGYPDCSWPDGQYTLNSGLSFFVLDRTICSLDGAQQIAVYGGAQHFNQVGNQAVGSGTPALTNIGTCPWPDGFYTAPDIDNGQTVVRVSDGQTCTMPLSSTNWSTYAQRGFQYRPGTVRAGPRPLTDANHDGIPDPCLWTDGDYQLRTNPDVGFAVEGTYACHMINREHLASRRNNIVLFDSTDPNDPNSPLFGRTPPTDPCLWGLGFYRTIEGILLVNDWDLEQWCQLRDQPNDPNPNDFAGGDIERFYNIYMSFPHEVTVLTRSTLADVTSFRGNAHANDPYAPFCLPEEVSVAPAAGVHLIGVTDGTGRLEQSVESGGMLSTLVDVTAQSHLQSAASGVAFARDDNAGLQTIIYNSAQLLHAIRAASGAWTGWGDITGEIGSPGSVRKAVMCNLPSGMHVVVLAYGTNALYHTIRFPDGTWQPWGDVRGAAGNPGTISDIACSADLTGPQLQLAVVAGGRLYHTIRFADRTWSSFGDVSAANGWHPGTFTALGMVQDGGNMQLMASTSDGGIWHTLRFSNGNWTGFGNVLGETGAIESGSVIGISGAMNGSTADFSVLKQSGRPWLTTRNSSGVWTAFRDLRAALAPSTNFVDWRLGAWSPSP